MTAELLRAEHAARMAMVNLPIGEPARRAGLSGFSSAAMPAAIVVGLALVLALIF